MRTTHEHFTDLEKFLGSEKKKGKRARKQEKIKELLQDETYLVLRK